MTDHFLSDAASRFFERLEPRGRMTRDGITWQGFHDPEEYKKGY